MLVVWLVGECSYSILDTFVCVNVLSSFITRFLSFARDHSSRACLQTPPRVGPLIDLILVALDEASLRANSHYAALLLVDLGLVL